MSGLPGRGRDSTKLAVRCPRQSACRASPDAESSDAIEIGGRWRNATAATRWEIGLSDRILNCPVIPWDMENGSFHADAGQSEDQGGEVIWFHARILDIYMAKPGERSLQLTY